MEQSQGSHRVTSPPPPPGPPARPAALPHPAPPPAGDTYGDTYGARGPDEPHEPYEPYDTCRPSCEQLFAPTAPEPPPGSRATAPAPRAGRAGARHRAGRVRGGAERTEALRRLLPQALVVAFLAGGTSAFLAHDKAIRLSVDGTPRTLHTFADDVGELLAEEDLKVGPHDIVAPSPREELASGDAVAVRYGRPLRLTLDGRRRTVWTTARTVEEALRQLGVRAEGAHLSVSRGTSIGRTGLELAVRSERSVTVLADGRTRRLRTNAATIAEVVEQAGVVLRGEDTTSVPPGSFPRDGQTITVLRITGDERVREETIAYGTERREDPELTRGTEVVERQGRPGVRQVTYRTRTVNGVRRQPRRIASRTVREPRTEIVRIGTRPLPRSVEGADGLNWQALAQCESGGRAHAVDSSGTHGGLYQFDTGTWRSLGGSGRPQDAPPEEQTFRAKKLYVQRGASPWPVCGRKLHQ